MQYMEDRERTDAPTSSWGIVELVSDAFNLRRLALTSGGAWWSQGLAEFKDLYSISIYPWADTAAWVMLGLDISASGCIAWSMLVWAGAMCMVKNPGRTRSRTVPEDLSQVKIEHYKLLPLCDAISKGQTLSYASRTQVCTNLQLPKTMFGVEQLPQSFHSGGWKWAIQTPKVATKLQMSQVEEFFPSDDEAMKKLLRVQENPREARNGQKSMTHRETYREWNQLLWLADPTLRRWVSAAPALGNLATFGFNQELGSFLAILPCRNDVRWFWTISKCCRLADSISFGRWNGWYGLEFCLEAPASIPKERPKRLCMRVRNNTSAGARVCAAKCSRVQHLPPFWHLLANVDWGHPPFTTSATVCNSQSSSLSFHFEGHKIHIWYTLCIF